MYIMVKFQEVNVIRFLPEMLLEKKVDCRFEHEGIVDGNISNVRLQ
jgi:hypothetical protein